MTKEEVLQIYEPVAHTDRNVNQCSLCDAQDQCHSIDGYNPYFRSCHDHGYLKRKVNPEEENVCPACGKMAERARTPGDGFCTYEVSCGCPDSPVEIKFVHGKKGDPYEEWRMSRLARLRDIPGGMGTLENAYSIPTVLPWCELTPGAIITEKDTDSMYLQYHADLEDCICDSEHPIGGCLKCDLERAINRQQQTNLILSKALRAICMTRDYCGESLLPAKKGWEWYDAGCQLAEAIPNDEWAREFRLRVEIWQKNDKIEQSLRNWLAMDNPLPMVVPMADVVPGFLDMIGLEPYQQQRLLNFNVVRIVEEILTESDLAKEFEQHDPDSDTCPCCGAECRPERTPLKDGDCEYQIHCFCDDSPVKLFFGYGEGRDPHGEWVDNRKSKRNSMSAYQKRLNKIEGNES